MGANAGCKVASAGGGTGGRKGEPAKVKCYLTIVVANKNNNNGFILCDRFGK
jgi:hypothetical protein